MSSLPKCIFSLPRISANHSHPVICLQGPIGRHTGAPRIKDSVCGDQLALQNPEKEGGHTHAPWIPFRWRLFPIPSPHLSFTVEGLGHFHPHGKRKLLRLLGPERDDHQARATAGSKNRRWLPFSLSPSSSPSPHSDFQFLPQVSDTIHQRAPSP